MAQAVSRPGAFRVIALDLDGVVYEGDSALPGAAEAVNGLARSGYRVRFITNNSGRSREGICRKLAGMGIHADPGDVLTSGYAACALMEGLGRGGASSVLVIGTGELKGEISRKGFRVVDEAPCPYLVVGLDPSFGYDQIAKALDALRQGATFIACNRDRSFPSGNGRLMPGCGPLVAAIEWAWGKGAHYDAGKPGPLMLEMISRRERVAPGEILVVGDSLESDVAMARLYGSAPVLVSPGGPAPGGDHGDGLLVVDSLRSLQELL